VSLGEGEGEVEGGGLTTACTQLMHPTQYNAIANECRLLAVYAVMRRVSLVHTPAPFEHKTEFEPTRVGRALREPQRAWDGRA
jgi:hypothetical protein